MPDQRQFSPAAVEAAAQLLHCQRHYSAGECAVCREDVRALLFEALAVEAERGRVLDFPLPFMAANEEWVGVWCLTHKTRHRDDYDNTNCIETELFVKVRPSVEGDADA